MKIGIDAYPLTRKIKAGISYYTLNLIKKLLEIDQTNEYVLYNDVSNNISLRHSRLTVRKVNDKNFGEKFSTPWLLFMAKKQLIKDNIKVFWGTQTILPLDLPVSIKTVSTVYDLTVNLYPHTMAFDNYLVNKLLFERSLMKTDKIIAISNTTARLLVEVYGKKIPSDKIVVDYCGIDTDVYKTIERQKAQCYIDDRLGISKEYILFVGTLEPRKNVPGLLKAFKLLKTEYKIPHQLVLCGAFGWKSSPVRRIYKELGFKENEVIFLNYVSQEDLVNLYNAASVFVLPSFYEGFGLPPLEAMSCGLPVAASDIPVFKEILQDAAIFVDPNNPVDIAKKINSLLFDIKIRISLIHKGYEKIKAYSWQESAQCLLKVFNSFV